MNAAEFFLILSVVYAAPDLQPRWRANLSTVFVALAAIFFILQVVR